MALVEINFKPAKKELTVFSIGGALILSIAAFLLYGRHHGPAWLPPSLVGVALVLLISRLTSLELTRRMYIVFVVVTYPIGWVLSHVILAIFYYGLLTPLGLVFRLMGRDPLQRRLDPNIKSYWTPHQAHHNQERYFRQF